MWKDSFPPQDEISWPVFCDLRDKWAGKIELQAVCLVLTDAISRNDCSFIRIADIVKESKGILGIVTFPVDKHGDRLRLFFELAAECGSVCRLSRRRDYGP